MVLPGSFLALKNGIGENNGVSAATTKVVHSTSAKLASKKLCHMRRTGASSSSYHAEEE